METQVPSPNTLQDLDNPQRSPKRGLAQKIALPLLFLLLMALAQISCKKTNSDINQRQVVPTITSVKPLSAKSGDTIIIIGTNFNLNPSMDTVKLNGITARVQKASSDTLYVIVPPGNCSGTVSVNGIASPGPVFTVLPAGVNFSITGVKPLTAKPGDTIIITGTNFNLNPAMDTIKFNGIPAQVIKAKADTLFVVVPTGNANGVVTVNGISAPGPVFTVLQLGVTGVIPGWGKQGDTIIITGTNFYLNPSEDIVMINGVNATVLKASADTLHVIVPVTSTGGITVNGVAAPAPDFIYAPTVFVTTIVGPGSPGSTEGPDSLVQINPWELSFDKQGNLYVAEPGDVRKISAGFVSTVANNYSQGSSNEPGGMTIDAQNNLYLTYFGGGNVLIISNGMVSGFTNGISPAGDLNGPVSTATFYNPGPLAVDAQGNMYVGEPGVIRKISPGGIVSTFAGKLPIVDSPGIVIQYPLNIRPSLGYVNGQDTAARFGHIGSLTTDAQGNVYAGDLECQCVRKITPSGIVSTLGTIGIYSYRDSYNMLSGLCADAAGNIYVSRQSAIYKISAQGATSALAGKVTSWPSDEAENYGIGYADGPATIALFNTPRGLACDAQGNIYVADSGNGRIRKITFQ